MISPKAKQLQDQEPSETTELECGKESAAELQDQAVCNTAVLQRGMTESAKDEKPTGKPNDVANVTSEPSFSGFESAEGESLPDSNDRHRQPSIDFVLYLQQTGSIIALAKLMDALEYGEDYDEGLDDAELKLIRQQQMLSRQATT